MRRSHRGVWKRKAMFYIYSFMYTCTCSGHRKLFTFLQELNAEIKRVEHLLTLRDFAIENLNIELLNPSSQNSLFLVHVPVGTYKICTVYVLRIFLALR